MRFLNLCTILLMLLVAGALSADDFSDFRIPPNTLWNGTFSLDGRINPTNQHGGERSQNQTASSGAGQINLMWQYDSDRLYKQLSINLGANASRNQNKYTNAYYYDDNKSNFRRYANSDFTRAWSENWSINGGFREYPWSAPWGLDLSGMASGQYSQSKRRSESNSYDQNLDNIHLSGNSNDRNEWNYQYAASLTGVIGYGRVRNATCVYNVHLIESRLIATGALKQPLSKTAREKIASLLYASYSYDRIHDRSAKFFWQDVVRILREDGALRETEVDAYSLYRLTDPDVYYNGSWINNFSIPQSFYRRVGYFAGLAISAAHNHYLKRASVNQFDYTTHDSTTTTRETKEFQRTNTWSDNLWLGVRGEYHRPLGLRWQTDCSGSLQVPTDYPADGLLIKSNVNIAYLVSDRLYANLYGEQSRSYEKRGVGDGSLQNSGWGISAAAGFYYYIEDHLKLGLIAYQIQSRSFPSTYSNSKNEPSFYRDSAISLTLGYHFFGQFELPGVIDPVRQLSSTR